jgi:coenzyme PQQ synthesis protein D (PqqD)
METESGSLDKTLHLREDAVAWRLVGDEVVALDVRRSTYLGLNRTGAVLWTALAKGATRRQLVALVLERFDVGPEEAARDIETLLTDLADRGLLEEVTAT